jgi:o-succinylbenzoate---CoA ligase
MRPFSAFVSPFMPAAAAVPTSTGTSAAGRVRGRAPAIQSFIGRKCGRWRPIPPNLRPSLNPMQELVAITQTGQGFVETLSTIWERGDAAMPLDPRLPNAARDSLITALAPTRIIEADGTEQRLNGRQVDAGDALVIATSGSTGTPKGVVHTHASLDASARSTSTALDVNASTDQWLCCLPLTHIAGLAIVVRSRTFEIPLVVHDRFDSQAVEIAAREGATLTSLVPNTLARLDPSLFRRIIVGGQAAPENLPDNCRASYGMTETGSAVVFDGDILPGVELRIVDGEIQVRGDMLLRCYRDGTDPRTNDGWFPTNDAPAKLSTVASLCTAVAVTSSFLAARRFGPHQSRNQFPHCHRSTK